MDSEINKDKLRICQICEMNPQKYLCPRCGVPYCSLACYKNESKHLQCSESFYRDCVVEHIRSEEVKNPESSQKMKEVLQRFHEQYNTQDDDTIQEELDEELDSDDDEPLDKRLAGVNLNDSEQVWNRLTEDEKKDFQNLVKNTEEAGDIIPEWQPWWYDKPDKKLVVEIVDNSNNIPENPLKLTRRQPEIKKDIPRLCELTKVKPNEQVAKGLINVIAAYVWTSRLYNGDLFDAEKLVEIGSSIVCLSSYLNKTGLFKNIEHAIADIPMNACKVPTLSEGGGAIQITLTRDVLCIIKGPERVQSSHAKGYLLSALTECYLVFAKASKYLKSKVDTSKNPKTKGGQKVEGFSKLFPTPNPAVQVDAAVLTNSKRRLLYLLSFANEFIDDYREIYASPEA